MTITKPTKEDIPELLIVTKACAQAMIADGIYQWNEDYPSYEAFEKDIEIGQLWVLKDDGNIIGSVVISELIDEEYKAVVWLTPNTKNMYIHRLAIHPNSQGKGLAQKLMDFAEAYAKENYFLSVRLDTFSVNTRNNAFYQKRGYQKLGDVYFPKQSEHPFHCYELVF
ncbi:MAG: GNAT family N-acetyltransferase [Kordia sp.]|nr:MAG: GNAT family N-acetyltransferase [Kordia sp.]